MDTKTILNEATGRMQKAIDHLEEELLNVRAGKASPNALNGVMVDYFGSQVPVSGAASVTVPDARTILIQPWDKNMLRPIEKAIIDSNIGLTPSNNGEQIRLTIPPLTEERRKELVKQVRAEAETARISLRNARRDAVEAFKKAQKEVQQRKGYLHKCAVCGITDADDSNMEFRYCSKCNGYYCYCSKHINNHTHVQ